MKRLAQRWNDWPLLSKGMLLVTLPLMLLMGALLSGYRLQQQTALAEAEARRTLRAQGDIQALHTGIAEAATGVRGYLLTGRDDFLTPYWKAEVELSRTIKNLRSILRDPTQISSLARVLPLLDAKLRSLDSLRTEGRFQSAEALRAHLLASKVILDQLRSEIVAMQAREAQLVEERTVAVGRALARNQWMNAATLVGALIAAMLAALLFYTTIVQRVRALAANAERLVQGAPLAAMPQATDELGLLAARLQSASVLLAQRASEAQAASQTKTDFLSRVSHELRTPLNAILGFAQLLDQDLAQTPQQKSVAHLLTAGRHLLTVIDQLLDIARIEAQHVALTPSNVAIGALLEEAQALVAVSAAAREIVIEPAVGDTHLKVWADRARLLQVLLNLYSNAIKYNQRGGWVRANVAGNAERVHITVADSGPGIATALQHRLFQPFERLGAGAQVEGLGLGLAISRQLLTAMNGDLTLHSRPGEGCQFTIALPAALAHANAALATRSSATSAAITSSSASSVRALAQPLHRVATIVRTLLCIEDNTSNLALIEALIARRPQWRLSKASTGQEGLKIAQAQMPDLILLDLRLPDLFGESVLSTLRSDAVLRTIPVVVLSADALPETQQRILAQGVVAYLTKPLDVRRFFAVLDGIHHDGS